MWQLLGGFEALGFEPGTVLRTLCSRVVGAVHPWKQPVVGMVGRSLCCCSVLPLLPARVAATVGSPVTHPRARLRRVDDDAELADRRNNSMTLLICSLCCCCRRSVQYPSWRLPVPRQQVMLQPQLLLLLLLQRPSWHGAATRSMQLLASYHAAQYSPALQYNRWHMIAAAGCAMCKAPAYCCWSLVSVMEREGETTHGGSC